MKKLFVSIFVAFLSIVIVHAEQKTAANPSSPDKAKTEKTVNQTENEDDSWEIWAERKFKNEASNVKEKSVVKKGKKDTTKLLPLMQKIFDSMTEEEKNELKKLYQENPDKFREKMQDKVAAYKKEQRKTSEELKNLLSKYHSSKDDNEKAALYKQIEASSRKEFLRRMEDNRKRLEVLEKQLKTLRQSYEFRRNNADKIINERVRQLTRDPNMEW